MTAWQTATVAFFVYTAVVSVLLPRLGARRRVLALSGSAAGLLVMAATAAARLAPEAILTNWIIPPIVLLLSYWTSGLLFVAPMPRAERALLRADEVLGIRRLASAAPRWLAEYLEFAYAAVYPVVPIALFIHLTAAGAPDAAKFWSVILITDFICFGMLPWIQTRPPRALEPQPPWRSQFRAFNLRLLGKTSIHANTLPSGHAAEALAATLLTVGAPPPLVLWMVLNALSITAGAVLGRYHYAVDALAGWAVAVAVWVAVMWE